MVTDALRPTRPFLTVTEVAARLRCSSDKVYELLDAGHFPGARRLDPSKPKSPWRIPRSAVDSFLAST